MSVVVKGMKMPELYETYKVNFAMTNDGKIVMGMCLLNETGYRPVGEVVALPDKHGRLVDADEIRGRMESVFNTSSHLVIGHTWGEAYAGGFSDAIDIVKEAQTIVEAEGEE